MSARAAARVSIELFSGRDAPGWDLGAIDAEALATRLLALPEGRVRPAPQLGYSGVHVLFTGSDTVVAATVFDGRAEIETEGVAAGTRVDPDRAVERWLLASGRRAHPQLVARLIEILTDRSD